MSSHGRAHRLDDFERAYAGRTHLDYRPLLGVVVRYAPPGAVLDLGAGLGMFVEVARRWGLECVGLEPSTEGVAAAADRGIDLVRGDLAERLPFGDDRFTAAVLNQVAEHITMETFRFALHETRRVLQPGGVVFVFTPTTWRRGPRKEETHVNIMAPRRVRRELESAGFTGVQSLAFGSSGSAVRLAKLVWALPPLAPGSSCLAYA